MAEGAIFYTQNLTRLPRDGTAVAAAYRTGTEKPASNPLSLLPAAPCKRVFPCNNKSCPIYLTVKIVRLYRTILLLFKAQYHKSNVLMCISGTVIGPFARVFPCYRRLTLTKKERKNRQKKQTQIPQ